MIQRILLYQNTQVLIIEHDPAVLRIWQHRLQTLITPDDHIKVLYFDSPQALLPFIIENPFENNTYFISDHFQQSSLQGHQLIQQLNIAAVSVLLCQKNSPIEVKETGLACLAKDNLKTIPIKIVAQTLDAILLDNSDMILDLWNLYAQNTGKKLMTFSKPAAMLDYMTTVHRLTPIFVDYDLGEEQTGFDICQTLSLLGFKNLHVTTGYGDDYFNKPSYVISIIDKTPDF